MTNEKAAPCVNHVRGFGTGAVLLPFLGLLLCAIPAFATQDRHPLEAANTSSPRATLESFNAAAKEAYDYFQQGHVLYRSEEVSPTIDRLFSCLDLSEVAPATRFYVASEAAICLKEVLDRLEPPPEETAPDADKVKSNSIHRWRISSARPAVAKARRSHRPK